MCFLKHGFRYLAVFLAPCSLVFASLGGCGTVLPGQKFANGQNGVKIWPEMGRFSFTNGQLNGQLSVLDYALEWSNFDRIIAWGMC